jgi:transposase InsO family protein
VSRRGYYDWVAAAPRRAEREEADLAAKEQVEAAYKYRGFKKGSRQVVDCLRRKKGVRMNRKKVQRITRKYGLAPRRKRKNPYKPIGTDGLPKVAPNAVDREFRRGEPLKVLSTDITYLPGRDGFSYLSGVIDCETDVVLAHVTSDSMEEQFVLDTYDQLKGLELPDDIWACSDQGVHYTARAYRDKLAELGINQSMSRKACCWDNAPIESFWGRMKEQIPATESMTHEEIAALVDGYVDYYNNERGQERLGWLTPAEYADKLAKREGDGLCSAA